MKARNSLVVMCIALICTSQALPAQWRECVVSSSRDPGVIDSTLGHCRQGRPGMQVTDFVTLAAEQGVQMKKRHRYVELVPNDCSVADCRYELHIGQYLGRRRQFLPGTNITYTMYRVVVFDPIGGTVLKIEDHVSDMSRRCNIRPLLGIDLHFWQRDIKF